MAMVIIISSKYKILNIYIYILYIINTVASVMEVETAIASYGWSSHLTVMMVLKLEKVFLSGFCGFAETGSVAEPD